MWRCVYDDLIAIDAKPHNFQITNALVVKYKQACSQYMAELEKKEEKMTNITSIEQKYLQEKISEVKRKKLNTRTVHMFLRGGHVPALCWCWS